MREELNRQKFIKMTEDPVEKLICKMAVPTIVSMLISAVYNMADTYFVGKLGTSATGAVGVVFSLMTVIQACGFFFGHGSGNSISRALGRQNTADAANMASVGFFASLAVGTVLGAAGIMFLTPLSRLLGSTETILPYTKAYLFYILCGTPFIMGSFVLNNQLRFQGSAVSGMVGMAAGGVLNIALDPLFIFVFKMGVGGAGCATLVSQIIGFVILLIGCRQKGNIWVSLRNFKFSGALFTEIFRSGFPSLCRQGLGSLAMICLNHVAGNYGADAAIAAMSIVSKVVLFAISALIGFGQGFQPVCGFNYGAGKFERVRRAFWFSVKVASVFLTVTAVVGFVLSPFVIAMFRSDDAEVIRIGTLALRAQCIALPFDAFVIISNMYLQTIGRAKAATAVAMSRQFIFFLPVLVVLTKAFGLLGVQLTQPVADVCAFVFAVPVTVKVLKSMRADTPLMQ